jgi:hypothetical protein
VHKSQGSDRLYTDVQVQVNISECFLRSLTTNIAHLENGSVSANSSDRDVIDNRGGVPRGVEMVVGCRERTLRRPVLVQEGREIVSVGGYPRIIYGNRDACDFHFFPSFRLVCLEDLVERLSVVRVLAQNKLRAGRTYLVVPGHGEGMVFQLFGGKIPQDIRNVSRNVCSGSE